MAYHHHADIQHVQYAESQQASSQSKQQQKANLRGHHNTEHNPPSKNNDSKNKASNNAEQQNTESSNAKAKDQSSNVSTKEDQKNDAAKNNDLKATDKKTKFQNIIASTTHNINIRTFSKKLSSISATTSSQKCAASIRVALQSAGARIVNHPVAAADWGNTLKDLGYRQITPSFEKPQPGDIYIIDRTKAHIYGHIAGFTGKEWVSDFKQAGHAVYKGNVSYRYFRLGS